MSFSSFEESVAAGNPVYLYSFDDGTNQTYFTSAAADVSRLGFTFIASSIKHGSIFVGNAVRKDTVDFEFPLDDVFASSYLENPTRAGFTTVNIYRTHLDDPDQETRVIFMGRIRGVKVKDNKIILPTTSLLSSGRREGLGASIQKPCRHALYTGGCRLNIDAFKTLGSAVAIAGTVVTVTEAALEADLFYRGGILIYNGVNVFITNHSGTNLTLRYIPNGMVDDLIEFGTIPVEIAPGCDRSIVTCRNKFANEENFGGFPYIPIGDPWGGGSVV